MHVLPDTTLAPATRGRHTAGTVPSHSTVPPFVLYAQTKTIKHCITVKIIRRSGPQLDWIVVSQQMQSKKSPIQSIVRRRYTKYRVNVC